MSIGCYGDSDEDRWKERRDEQEEETRRKNDDLQDGD